jgi:formate/nitrite transporter FocA (FNT family)
MNRILIFLSGVCFATTIALAFHAGYELFTTGHVELSLLRVEEATALAQTSRAAAYVRELAWLGTLALSILLFQLGSRIDEHHQA